MVLHVGLNTLGHSIIQLSSALSTALTFQFYSFLLFSLHKPLFYYFLYINHLDGIPVSFKEARNQSHLSPPHVSFCINSLPVLFKIAYLPCPPTSGFTILITLFLSQQGYLQSHCDLIIMFFYYPTHTFRKFVLSIVISLFCSWIYL